MHPPRRGPAPGDALCAPGRVASTPVTDRAEDTSSSRIVLVHGFTQSAASWARVADRLRRRHDVLAVDLPGHGSASAVRVADLAGAARAVASAGGRAAYVGYSLGGRCCLTLALDRPDLVERLVLVGATAGIVDASERSARRQADAALADQLDPPGAREADGPDDGTARLAAWLTDWLAGPLFAHLGPEQADLASRLVNTPEGLASSLRSVGTGTQVPTWDRLRELSMPVVLVTGERDEKFTAIAEKMRHSIGPNASHVVVPGVGHAVPFEAPAAFAEIVERAAGLTARCQP